MGPHGMGFPNNGLDDQGWRMYITAVVMIILSGLFVIARCTTRIGMSGKLGWDDFTIVVALAFSVVLSTMMCLAIENGYGMHVADLKKAELRLALKQFFIAQTPYKITVGLNKVATILLYLRIFISRSFRMAAFLVLFVVVSWTVATVGATIGQCVPIQGAWDKTTKATCIDSDVFWIAYAVGNIITDVMVLALPIPSILSLKLNMRDKVLLCGIFLLGGFVTVTSIIRVTSVQNSLKNKGDLTYNFIQRGIWTIIEANLGTISTCLPVLKQPLGRMFPRLFGSTKKGSSYYVDGSNQGRGYNLSKIPAEGSTPGLWRGPPKGRQTTSVSGPEKANLERKSDEQYIFTTESTKGSERDRDSDLDSPGSYKLGGISKRVDLVRTSFHEEEQKQIKERL
ncbi:integral membrane protein [Coniochaeta ligniaria NRRL 30616]|uniref:Integral membrane protein n=1 Tax=Coniochaeta ligniaria NRRL 30616 TaxID=1408157 RepID=A0A1J7IUB5_9PEZI|nr:integral membrane protein [Coniochaeta ligniaria NRRL 30616]